MGKLDEALELLARSGIADEELLRDALWLSRFLPEYPLEEAGERQIEAGAGDAVPQVQGERQNPPAAPKPEPELERPAAGRTRLYPSIRGSGGSSVAASPVHVPASGALPQPLELARALRPFGRKARGRRLSLDVAATVEETAARSAGGLAVAPVYSPTPERWFSVALVFDDTPGMTPWRKTADELARLLRGLGLFRDVREWMLTPELRLRSRKGAAASAGQLRDPSGRTMVLVLTNGVGRHWRGRPLMELLERWATCGPVALCSMLPPKRWAHTDLGPAALWVQSPVPGAANGGLRVGEGLQTLTPGAGETAYPVFPLSKEGLARWAGMQMSRREQRVNALLLAPEWFDGEAPPAEEVIVPRRVAEFAAMASPEALSLLRYFSAVPLTLPIMRLVQATMLPGSPLSAMSEVLMSGLVRPVNPEGLDPETVRFDFVAGAREELRGITAVGELERIAVAVREEVRKYIEAKAGVTIDDFEAWVADAGGRGRLPAEAEHFAEVMSGTLAALGYEPPKDGRGNRDRLTVFVSYAHADDEKGEVSRLIEEVQRRVGERIGRRFSIFRSPDTASTGGDWWKGEDEKALEAAALYVPIVSRKFLASDYCMRELRRARDRERYSLREDLVLPVLWRGQRSGPREEPVWEYLRSRAMVAYSGATAEALSAEIVRRLGGSVLDAPRAGDRWVNPVDGLTYVWIPPGEFAMGASEGDMEAYDDEKPRYAVELTRGFWMGETPVTQGAWERVMGKNPSHFKGEDRPVERVRWKEAAEYCAKVGGRLPSEAEWEYAARAGTTGPRYGELDAIAWYDGNSGGETHAVKGKEPNGWGLYDTLGNVWEWVEDWYGPYSGERQVDPKGPGKGTSRALRGGSWFYLPRYVRASVRNYFEPEYRFSNVGFRCAGEFR